MTVQFKAFIRTIMTCQSENLELYYFEQQLTILCGICAHTWQSSCMSSYNHKGCHWIILHVNPVVKRQRDIKTGSPGILLQKYYLKGPNIFMSIFIFGNVNHLFILPSFILPLFRKKWLYAGLKEPCGKNTKAEQKCAK